MASSEQRFPVAPFAPVASGFANGALVGKWSGGR
jgi:hypothetical protein